MTINDKKIKYNKQKEYKIVSMQKKTLKKPKKRCNKIEFFFLDS